MKRKVETRKTGEKSRKCITSTLQELSLRKSFFSDKKHASHQGKEPSLFLARAVFLAKKVFPACYFALHDSLRDTRPFGNEIGKGAKWVAWLLPLQIAHNLEIGFRTMFVLFLQKALFAVLCQLLLRHPGRQGLQFTVAEHYFMVFVVVVESR